MQISLCRTRVRFLLRGSEHDIYISAHYTPIMRRCAEAGGRVRSSRSCLVGLRTNAGELPTNWAYTHICRAPPRHARARACGLIDFGVEKLTVYCSQTLGSYIYGATKICVKHTFESKRMCNCIRLDARLELFTASKRRTRARRMLFSFDGTSQMWQKG